MEETSQGQGVTGSGREWKGVVADSKLQKALVTRNDDEDNFKLFTN